MATAEDKLSTLSRESKAILFQFMAFPDIFSIDWFTNVEGILPSHLLSLILFLKKRRWIESVDTEGHFTWTPKFPREEIATEIPEEEKINNYRKAAEFLLMHMDDNEENVRKVVQMYLLAGIRESDIDLILKAALIDEKNQRVESSVWLYDNLLTFMARRLGDSTYVPGQQFYQVMLKAIERRTAFCLTYPSSKKLNSWLRSLLQLANDMNDFPTQCALELLLGINHWMNYQYEQARLHLDKSWPMINKIADDKLKRKALQLKGLLFLVDGEIANALRSYEASLNDLEEIITDDFTLMTIFQLALCYAQSGMTQRGLGITDMIYSQYMRTGNKMYHGYGLVAKGTILLKMNRIEESRTYLERYLETKPQERSISMIEISARLHLGYIYSLEGNHERVKACIHSTLVHSVPKSRWFHALNNIYEFESGFMLIQKGFIPRDFIKIYYKRPNPLFYAIVRRLHIKHIEGDRKIPEKIRELQKLEKSLERMGASMELGHIKIDLADLYLKMNNWFKAESYGGEAWDLMKNFAKDLYPMHLASLLNNIDLTEEKWSWEPVIKLLESLTAQGENDHTLSVVVDSISGVAGAERVAIFRTEAGLANPQVVASRNVTPEDFHDDGFREILLIIEQMNTSKNRQTVIHEKILDTTSKKSKAIVSSLIAGGKHIGLLYLEGQFFRFSVTAENIGAFNTLASQIAIVIDRIWAHEEIAHLNEKLLEVDKYYRDEKDATRTFGDIVGSSPAIMKIYGLIRKVAATNSTVLIQGETGVGKELVARAIHRESNRKEGPFIRVNCAALPESLIDSELFGHEKGSFTGATRMKPGRFELADKGTIFLDEISELPLPTQSRLLRILQEKEFQRVGGTKTLHADFRLIAATNKNLEGEVESNRFRPDLFYRINVFPITVPSLRDRKEDIALLSHHFLKLFSSQYNKPYHGIHQTEMEKLLMYNWPGNVRELANIIERAVILGEPGIRFPEKDKIGINLSSEEEPKRLQEVEGNEIKKALIKTKGVVGGINGAAAILGLKRTTLINRMKKLGMCNSKRGALLSP